MPPVLSREKVERLFFGRSQQGAEKPSQTRVPVAIFRRCPFEQGIIRRCPNVALLIQDGRVEQRSRQGDGCQPAERSKGCLVNELQERESIRVTSYPPIYAGSAPQARKSPVNSEQPRRNPRSRLAGRSLPDSVLEASCRIGLACPDD